MMQLGKHNALAVAQQHYRSIGAWRNQQKARINTGLSKIVLADPIPWLGATIWRKQEDSVVIACRQHHPVRHAKTHLARCKIGNHHGQAIDEGLRRICATNAAKHIPRLSLADI